MVARVRSGLVAARKRQGHTLESLAFALNVEPATVRRWERGTSDPMPLTWPRLAHELDITTDELVGFLAKPCCEECGKVLAADNTDGLCGACRRVQHGLDEPPQVGDDFFDTAELQAAFDSWHIGRVFRAYRSHPYFVGMFARPLTQENLGRWLGLNQNQMSIKENGKAEQNLELLREWAAILHLPQRMLWFDMPGQSRHRSSTADDSVASALVKPWKVGRDALDALAAILSSLRRLEDTTSSAAVVAAVDANLETAVIFAKEANSAHRQQAVRLAAEMSTYRGWLAIDLQDWPSAERRLNDATALSIDGHAQSLLVEAVGFQSYAALRRGEYVAAVSLRHAATPLAQTPVEQSVALLHLARTLAITGDVTASDKALTAADVAIERAEGTERDDHHYYVTDPWLQVQHGLVHAHAGRPQQAARDIEVGLAEMPEQQRQSDWAKAYAGVLERLT